MEQVKIDWVAKLTSRKLWMAIVGLVSSLMVAFGVGENQVAQVAAIIMAAADVIGYMLAEGLVDASRARGDEGLVVELGDDVE